MYTYKNVTTLTDLTELLQVYQQVFALADLSLPSSKHLQSLLDKPSIIFLVACQEERVVGGLTAYILPSVYSEKNEMYLYDLAVLAEFQRKGIGKALLVALKEEARALQVSEIFVQADIADSGALAFYRATGGIEEEVRHFGYVVE